MVEIMKRGTRGRIARPKTWQAGVELCLAGTVRGVDYMPGHKRQTITSGGKKGTEVVGTRAETFASEHPDDAMDCLNRVTMDLAREEDFEGAMHWQTLADSLGEWLATPFAERDPWEVEPEPEPKKKKKQATEREKPKGRSATEIDGFYRAINRRSLSGARFFALVRLIHYTGLRVGEALELELRDLVWEAGYVDVRRSKTPSGIRNAMMPSDPERREELWDAMQKWLEWREEIEPESDLVFVSRTGAPLAYNSVNRSFMRVSERAGLKDGMTAHTLRHTYASVLLSKGAPLTGVAKQLGHKNPDITARVYSHVINREQQDAVSRF